MKKLILALMMVLLASPAWADFQVATGTITSPTSTGNASVTGLSFQPKLIILMTTTVSALTGQVNQGIGFCADSTHRWSSAIAANNGTGAIVGGAAQRVFKTTECLTVASDTANAYIDYLEADLVSMDAGGFTLNWTTVQASGKPVYWVALGGSSLNVAVGSFTSGVGTGSQSVSGLAFQPSTILIASAGTTAGTATTSADPTIGFGQSSSQRLAYGSIGSFNAGAWDSHAAMVTTEIIDKITNGAVFNATADLTSLDASGFTINFSANTAARDYGYVALSGVLASSGVFNQPAATGHQSVSGLSFQPSFVMFVSRDQVSSSTIDAGDGAFSLGVGVDSSHQFAIATEVGPNGNNAGGNAGMDGSSARVIQLISQNFPTPSLTADADFISMDSTGFTLNWDTADATAREVGYWALGVTASPSTTSTIYTGPTGVIRGATIR